MSKSAPAVTDPAPLVAVLLSRHGRTFAAELGIRLRRNTPAPLFRLLCFAALSGAPVQSGIALQATRALAEAGWTTPAKLAESRWRTRVTVLNGAGYARIDERTATQLTELNDRLQADYRGDLRRLRAVVDGDAEAAQRALRRFTGVGAVAAAIFMREIQVIWPEFHPFADRAALRTASRLGLPSTVAGLAECVDRADFARLIAALVRTRLAGDCAALHQEAARRR